MLRRTKELKNKKNGQSIIEYSIIIGIVTLAYFAMTPLIQRGSQAVIKYMADQVGNQQEGDQRFNIDTGGQVLSSYTESKFRATKKTRELQGLTNYTYSDITYIDTQVETGLGFTEEILP